MTYHHSNYTTTNRLEPLEKRWLLASAVDAVLDHDHKHEPVFDNYLPITRSLHAPEGFLTGRRIAPALTIAKDLLTTRATDLGMTPADVKFSTISNQYTDADSGMTHVYFRQAFNGLPVINADAAVHVMGDGRVLTAHGGFVPGLAGLQTGGPVQPLIGASDALTIAATELELTRSRTPLRLSRASTFGDTNLSLDPIPAKLQYVATQSGVELAWGFVLRTPDQQHWYDVSVGHESKQIIFIADWVAHATYNVLARPVESPADGSRSIETDPWDLAASPFGWHDTNGAAGAEFTDTRGNNVFAQEDADNNNTGGFRPSGGAALNFDFPLDLTQEPIASRSAAITNLFYWNNVSHDIHYRYGFTEAAGNFQVNNYGKGGIGNDPVNADAQDGGGVNNANFATPPDGSAPRMQMYIFTPTNPDRDGSLQNEIIIHEYGHGVSTRLTGGPSNSNSLNAMQSGGMGEGWSDWWGLMFTQKSTDTKLGRYPVGNWVLGQGSAGSGIRRFPYSFNMSINPLTIDAYGTSGVGGGVIRSIEVHDTGEIWCSALWDMNWLLIDKYGFEPNIENGYDPDNVRGNTLALKLVMDALKLQPSNPSFRQARDAILLADVALTGGANQDEIWAAFARRGMGLSFATTSSNSASVTPAFDAPVSWPFVTSATPTGTVLAPVSNVTLTFNQEMDTTSFSVADDVSSFTGPGNVDLRPTISGFSWLTSSQLRINFASVLPGAYSMTIGPDILAADDASPMNQNGNGLLGEASDAFTIHFTFATTLGPDGYGYRAAQYPIENIDLVIGAPDVTTLSTSSSNASSTINIGTNTFNFYGQNFTGTQISVNPNGLITFGSGSTASDNGDLTTSPTQGAIAALWDDWTAAINAPGATDSAILYKLEDITGDATPDRLIIEWSDIAASSSADGAITFQAILILNTGTIAGQIYFNYPDLELNNAGRTRGASATVGIKDFGAQGDSRLLVSLNSSTNPWVQSSQAVVIGLDVQPPTVVSGSFDFLTSQQFVVQFSEDVSASLNSEDLVITNQSNQIIDPATIQVLWDAATKTARFRATTTLPDGDYTARLLGTGITDAFGNRMDGDSNGIAGGHYEATFYVLAGDADRSRQVDVGDLGILASNWQQSPRDFSQGDFDYSGIVDVNDLGILASQWQQKLVALPAPFAPFDRRPAPVRPSKDMISLEELLTLV